MPEHRIAVALLLFLPLLPSRSAGAPLPQWRNVSPEGGPISAIAVNDADPRQAIALTSAMRFFETRDQGVTWREKGVAPCAPNRLVSQGGAYYAACIGGVWRTGDGGASWKKFSQRMQPEHGNFRTIEFSSMPGEAIAWGSFGAAATHDDGTSWFPAGTAFDVVTGSVVPGSRRAFSIQWKDGTWRLFESTELGGAWVESGASVSCPYATFCATAIASDAAGRLYVTQAGGVYVRRDTPAMRYWNRVELGLSGSDHRVAVDPKGRALAYTDSTAALSTDGGASWSRFALPAAIMGEVAFASDDSIWAAMSDGVWRREGDGPWSHSASGLRAGAAMQAQWASTDKPKLLAYMPAAGWMQSDDEGETWRVSPLTAPYGRVTLLAPSNELWLASYGGGTSGTTTALYRSRDEGTTWEAVNPDVKTAKGNRVQAIPGGADARIWYGTVLVDCSYTNPSCDTIGLAVSRDGGRSWEDLSAPEVSTTRLVVPSPATSALAYASTSTGWFRTRDEGRTWSAVTRPSDGFGMLVPDAVEADTVYAYSPATFRMSRDAGATWIGATLPDTHGEYRVTADPWEAGRLYAQVIDGSIVESRDHGASWKRLVATDGYSLGSSGPAAVRRDGTGRAFAIARGNTVEVARSESSALFLGSDLWWNPAESGMGLSITQHASGQLFVVWFVYDEQRRGTWYVVPGGSWNGATFTGVMYKTTGNPLGRAFDASRNSVERVGTLTLAFDSADAARLSYAFDGGPQGAKRIQRQLFGPPAGSQGSNHADLWWDASQPGSGFAISHQYDKVFAAWYVYDAAGRPQWIVLPDSTRKLPVGDDAGHVDSIYEGTIYTAEGPPLAAAFDPAAVRVTPVGTARLRFVGQDEAWLEYTLSGLSGQSVQLRLTRQPF